MTILVVAGDLFLSKPKNVAVMAGQRMDMECRTDNGSKVTAWYYYSSTASIRTTVTLAANTNSKIQFSPNISSQFGVDFDANGSGKIYLNSTSIEDAGIYTCEVENNWSTVKYSAQLIVFGNH